MGLAAAERDCDCSGAHTGECCVPPSHWSAIILTPFPPYGGYTHRREIRHGVHVTDGPERLFWPNKSYPPPALGV